MARRPKYVPRPKPTVREGIRNLIKTSNHGYKPGEGFTTTLHSIYTLYTHDRTEEEVNEELSKWVDLEDVEIETPFMVPAKFFE